MKNRIKRITAWSAASSLVLLVAALAFGLWSASNQLLAPSLHGMTKDFSACPEETARRLGTGCGNLRMTRESAYAEVGIPSAKGGEPLPGWLLESSENGAGPARGVILLVHPGGADRRYMTRHARFYLGLNLDVLTFDYSCHGEAPCRESGLSYGYRESEDVLSAYRFLKTRYDKVYAMGSSVGATSLLVALPKMPDLAGLIAENPFVSFERLIKEAPEARGMPGFFVGLLIGLAEFRGGFDGTRNPAASLPLAKSQVPVLFIHSRADKVVSWKQTEHLAGLYSGPKTAWYPEAGGHAAVWDAVPDEYARRVAEFMGP